MDDNLSIKSSDSVTTSGEYEIVAEELDTSSLCKQSSQSPTLNIGNNGNIKDLEKNLNEVIHELDRTTTTAVTTAAATTATTATKRTATKTSKMDGSETKSPAKDSGGEPTSSQIETKIAAEQKQIFELEEGLGKKESTVVNVPQQPLIINRTNSNQLQSPELNKVGQSVFYDCVDLSPMGEKQDDMKPERSDTEEEMSEIDQDCTIFSGVTYLASATINAPKSETEIQRKITELNLSYDDDSVGLKVSISIPICSEGLVVLHDATSNAVIAHYEVNRILYYARGPTGSSDQACFAFTWANGDTPEATVFQCHVFRCHIPEAVNQVSSCFARSFQRPLPLSLTNSTSGIADSNSSIMIGSITSDAAGQQIASAGYEFIVALQIREKITKNNYTAATRDRACFKLRCNTDKEIALTVKQTPSANLQPLLIERCFGVLLSPGKLVRQADMQLLDMVIMGYVKDEKQTTITASAQASSPLSPYIIRAEWKANDRNFEQLNAESPKMYITVAVDLVIKGIREPVRFIIETLVSIQPQNEIRIMDHFNFSSNKKTMTQRFYLQLKDSGEGSWEVSSIDPSEEIVETTSSSGAQSSLLKNFGINSISKMVRSTSAISIEQDDSATEYSSDGDEPLLSGTGEVSKDCSQITLDEWDPILLEWTSEKRPKSLMPLVRLGVPEALRGIVWRRLANVESKTEIIDMYRVLLTKETKCESVIQRDIHRTFPAHKSFKESGGSGQDALFKVSKAYAVYDVEVGYCQGLSFIAASLLLHMPEEEAFTVLVSLMYNYGLRDLYKDGFENLYLRLYQLNRLIQDQLPKLYEHFEINGVETHMFASQWFLTLFTARFPLYFVFHILDVVLLDGIDIIFQVAMTLLEKYESELRQLDFEGMLRFFRIALPKKCRTTSNAKKLMKIACDKKVKKLKQYKEEFLSNKEATEKEAESMKQYEIRFDNERKQFRAEIIALQNNLTKTIDKSATELKRKTEIIDDYKQIIQRHEQQITKLNDLLTEYAATTSKCSTCSSNFERASNDDKSNSIEQKLVHSLGSLDPVVVAQARIRELELELAQTKLAHVEAQCKNQDLNHQLNTTLTEIQNHRNSWQPWLTKTFNSLQEKVASSKRDTPSFQSYTCNSPTPSCNSLDTSQDSPNMHHRKTSSNDSSIGRNSLDQTKSEATTNNLTCNSIK